MLYNYGLVASINVFTDSKRKLIDISFDENIGSVRLPKNIELVCFRIIKELINNTLKYAQATNVAIIIDLNDNFLTIHYTIMAKDLIIRS